MSINLDDFMDSEEVDIATNNITVAATGGTTSFKLEIDLLSKKTFTVNGVSFEMIGVKGGTFMMGPPDNSKHSETVNDFYIGKFEVTQKLWKAVMGSNPSKKWIGDDLPVEYVLIDDCRAFIDKLNKITGKEFRLLTIEEWEYAARGGVKSRGFVYSGSNNAIDVGVFDDTRIKPVGSKKPNELGIYDMSGNVGEFCIVKSDSGNKIKEQEKGGRYYQAAPYDKVWGGRGLDAELIIPYDSRGFRIAIDK